MVTVVLANFASVYSAAPTIGAAASTATGCVLINLMVLESQLPPNIVNLLFTIRDSNG